MSNRCRAIDAQSVYRPDYSVPVSHRPLATVSGLTIGDYLLWNWSSNANHDVLALVSGLTLPPLAVACAWLLALTAARLIAARSRDGHRARSSARDATAAAAPPRRRGRRLLLKRPARPVAVDRAPAPAAPSASTSSQRRSRKIAA
jgi:hypothetical protein